jgi:hypothetical protein
MSRQTAASARRKTEQENSVGKILFALLTAVIAWFLFKGLSKKSRGDASDSRVEKDRLDKSTAKNAVEHMVKCGVCGVFMPESESTKIDGKISCRDPKTCAHRGES